MENKPLDSLNKLEQALYYREKHDFSIIPIGKDKKPLVNWEEYQKIKPTINQIKQWWKNNPDANIAVVTGNISNIIVVDIDPRNGGTDQNFKNITTTSSYTGGDGMHYFFRYEKGFNGRIGIKKGIDIKSDGGYVILPFSDHSSGKKYTWRMNPQTPMASLPLFVKNWFSNKTNPKSTFDPQILTKVELGTRNDSAASLIGKLLFSLPPDSWEIAVWGYIKWWNTNKVNPPLEEKELRGVFDSIKKKEMLRSTSHHINNGDLLTNELEIISFEDFINKPLPQNQWLVDKLIPENGITCISGRPKSGKSLITLYLAICLATGKKFMNQFAVKQSGVLYISKDEPDNLTRSRLLKMAQNEKKLPIAFTMSPNLFLDTDENIPCLTEVIKNKSINVVIIDSFRRIFRGEENSSQVISDVQNRFQLLLKQNVTIIFIHHHGKEGYLTKTASDKLRGSSDILAMLDCLLVIEKKDKTILKITQSEIRSTSPIPPITTEIPLLDQGATEFNFLGYTDEEKEKKDIARDDILALLNTGKYNQKDIINTLIKNNKYSATTIKNVIKELHETKKVDFELKGKEKIYYKVNTKTKESVIEQEKLNK